MTLLLDALFSSVALSHLIVDTLNGQRAVLLAYLSGPLGLSNAALGLISTIYVVSAALMQPVFGFLTDRIGPRWVVAGGVLWMAVFFSMAVSTPGQTALVFLILASLGSGAFHPAGTMQATLRGRNHMSGQETTATAYFFVFGQMGLFFGPIVGGPLLERFGPLGLLSLSMFAFPVGLNAAWQLRYTVPAFVADLKDGNPGSGAGVVRNRPALFSLLAFATMAAFQSWVQQNMITFVPKYLSDLGQPASIYGLVVALFMGGYALGNILGGNMADRFGKRRVAVIALTAASVPLFLVPAAGLSAWLYLLVPLAGMLTGATYSIIVVLAQRIIPGGMAMASGLILGFMFSTGSLGTLLTGHLADIAGFAPVFHMNAAIAFTAALLALSLQRR